MINHENVEIHNRANRMAGSAGRSVAGVSVFRLPVALQGLPQCRCVERGYRHGIDRGLFERPSETLSRAD